MDGVNIDLIKNWIDEGEKRYPDMNLLHFKVMIPEEYIDRYCEIYAEMVNDAPDECVEYTTVLSWEDRRNQKSYWEEKGQISHIMLTEDEQGTLSGITEVITIQSYPLLSIRK